ncbi:MAG: hypothetical protein IKN17_09710 [Ruminococcus sp.]|nr:hypothetical protein [Ruminococcus sp.]
MPDKSDSKEYKVYSEYLDFYDCTGNFYIVFTEPGSYTKLADLLGRTLDAAWPEELCSELKCAYFSFCRKCRSVLKIDDDRQGGYRQGCCRQERYHLHRVVLYDDRDSQGRCPQPQCAVPQLLRGRDGVLGKVLPGQVL